MRKAAMAGRGGDVGEVIRYIHQCVSTFFLQRNFPQTYALLMEPYAMIQVSRTVVEDFDYFAEPWLKNTAIEGCFSQFVFLTKAVVFS